VSYTFFMYSSGVCISRHVVSHNIYFAFPRSYTDPVDGSKAANQGLILFFEYPNGNPARVVFRLSGTGSAGATIRVYLERFEKDVAKHGESAPVALKGLADRAVHLVKMNELTGRDSPTVIT
jgi:phosphoglucomutase